MVGVIIFVAVGVVLAAILLWLFSERWHLLLPSTWKVIKAGGLRNLLNTRTIHSYIYKMWTEQYVRIVRCCILPFARRWSKRKKKWLADHHHGKVLTPELAQAVIANDREIPLHDLEQIIPYSTARDLVLNASPNIAVSECACRQTRQNPCQPTLVCMVIGQPFVDFVLEHHPNEARRFTQAEALELLRAEHKRGHIHTAWFKDVLLNRLYAICNCCKCCCGGIEAMFKYGIPALAPSGYVARVEKENCTACAICEEACPFEAVQVDKIAVVDREVCMGCGVCVGQCPNEAILLELDEDKGIPLDVRLLARN